MEYKDIINEMLADLLAKTIDKKITWNLVNNNTIRWVKPGASKSIVTLQKQVSPNPSTRENYVMTIQSPPLPSTQFNTVKDVSLKDKFIEIFSEAMKEYQRIEEEKRIEVIKNLLKDI